MAIRIGDAIVSIGADTSDLNKAIGNFQRDVKRELGNILNTTKQIGFALTGIGAGLTGALGMAVSAYGEAEKASMALDTALAANAGKVGLTRKALDDMARSLSNVSIHDDDVITGAQALLLQFDNLGQDIFPKAMQAALDMSTAMDMDLNSAIKAVGLALNDPERGLKGLKFITADTKEFIQETAASGRVLEAQNLIIQEFGRFAGRAKTEAEGFQGSLKQLQNEAGNLAEEIGKALLPTLQSLVDDIKPVVGSMIDWAQKNPGLTTALVGTTAAVAALSLALGPLLIALPTIVSSFGMLSTTLGAATAVIGGLNPLVLATVAALGAFLLAYRAIAEERAVNAALKETNDLMQKTIQLGKEAGLSQEQLQAMAQSSERAAQKIGEAKDATQLFSDMVKHAKDKGVKPLTGDIEMWVTAQDKSTKATKSYLPSLQEQIAKQKDLIANLEKLPGKEDELIEATAKLEQMQNKQAAATNKLTTEINSWGAAMGVTIPRLQETVTEGEKYVAHLIKTKASAGEVAEAEKQLELAKKNLTEALHPQIKAFNDLNAKLAKNKEMLPFISASVSDLALDYDTELSVAVRDHNLLQAAAEHQAEKLEGAYKSLGVKSTAELIKQRDAAKRDYEIIRDSGTASAQDIDLAFANQVQNDIDLSRQMGIEVPKEMQVMVDGINAKWGEAKDKSGTQIKGIGEIWKNQVSTIVTDFGGAVADVLFEGGSFGKKMGDIFSNLGKSIVRFFIEDGVNRVLSALTGGSGGGLLGKIGDAFGGLFDKIGKQSGAVAGGGTGGAGGILGTLASGGIGAAVGIGIGLLAKGLGALFGKDKNKLADTEIVQKGWPEIWKLQHHYAAAPVESGPGEEANRKAVLIAGIEGWNEMARAFKRPESKTSQRPYIFDFIKAIDANFKARVAGIPNYSPGSLSIPIQPLAQGGVVLARPGGTVVRLAEAGQDEAVIPLGRGGRRGRGRGRNTGLGNTISQTNNISFAFDDPRALERMLEKLTRKLGNQYS